MSSQSSSYELIASILGDASIANNLIKVLSEHGFQIVGNSMPVNHVVSALKAIHALREPHYTFARTPNTIRQHVADILVDQQSMIHRQGLALMMIREGCSDAKAVAINALTRRVDT